MAMWQFEPEVVAGLLIAAGLYAVGIRRDPGAKWWRHALFFGGLAALAAALLSHRWGLDEERIAERRRRMGTVEAAAGAARMLPRRR